MQGTRGAIRSGGDSSPELSGELPTQEPLARFSGIVKTGPDGRAREFRPAPAGILAIRTASLPPPSRHLRKDVRKTLAVVAAAQLKIAFPPDGARVDLGLAAAAKPSPGTSLALKAEGGVLPPRWIVNGTPIGEADLRRQPAWTADGAGFTRITVTDAQGATDSVLVRLE